MRYLKRQTINRRIANDQQLYVDPTNATIPVPPTSSASIVLGTNGAVMMPYGNTSQQPGTAVNGMIRYNSQTTEFEGYQGATGTTPGKWRSFRFKEATQVIQQNLGAGDDSTVYFGPLNATYYNPSNISSNVSSFGGQNILVVVENVLQLSGINYDVVNNPASIAGTTYVPTLSYNAVVGSTTLYFNTSLTGTGASGNGATVTLTFVPQVQIPFAIGSTIVVTGFNPSGYNGTYTVTGSTDSSVSYASATNAAFVSAGNIQSTLAKFPSVDITGASVTGSNIPLGTVIDSYTYDSVTDALTSITISQATTTSTIAVNTPITISDATNAGIGYFLKFSSPVPYGKVVTALLGFDQ
jgi:hypothetical protein